MAYRIGLSAFLLVSILFLPYWVSLVLVVLGIIIFSIYFEGVTLLFLSDLLFGIPEHKLFNLYFFSFFLTLLLLIGAEFLKKKLKFYNKQ